MEHVASKLTLSNVRTDPFPHIVLDKVFDDETYDTFVKNLPSLDCFQPYFSPKDLKASNRGLRVWAKKLEQDARIHRIYQDFFRVHSSASFYDAVLRLFDGHIRQLCPQVFEMGEKRDTRAFFYFNTPTSSQPKPVRRPHLDVPEQLFLLLVYLRHPDDRSTGADLELYRYKDRFTGFYRGSREGDPATIRGRQVERRATIPYRGNNGIIMLNSIDALHGVTPRSKTPFLRYGLSVGVKFDTPLYDHRSVMTSTDRIRDQMEELWFSYYLRARDKFDRMLCRRS